MHGLYQRRLGRQQRILVPSALKAPKIIVLVCPLLLWLFCEQGHCFPATRGAKASNQILIQRNSLAISLTTSTASSNTTPDDPPWTFKASRIYYQFLAIPTETARTYCPPCRRQNQENGDKSKQSSSSSSSSSTRPLPLQLASFGGVTLGGIFCIDYQESPVGPYREVAVLSSLVVHAAAAIPPRFSIGAWASHIFVDSLDAATYGQEFWGLPAKVLPIDFLDEDHDEKTRQRRGSPHVKCGNDSHVKNAGSIVFTDTGVCVSGWPSLLLDQDGSARDGTSSNRPGLLSLLNVSLPSFSGLLPLGDEKKKPTSSSPLLQYPLSIVRPSSIGIVPSKTLCFDDTDRMREDKNDMVMQQVQSLLKEGRPLLSIHVKDVELIAGVPKVILSGKKGFW